MRFRYASHSAIAVLFTKYYSLFVIHYSLNYSSLNHHFLSVYDIHTFSWCCEALSREGEDL